jgi:hypothetical protein
MSTSESFSTLPCKQQFEQRKDDCLTGYSCCVAEFTLWLVLIVNHYRKRHVLGSSPFIWPSTLTFQVYTLVRPTTMLTQETSWPHNLSATIKAGVMHTMDRVQPKPKPRVASHLPGVYAGEARHDVDASHKPSLHQRSCQAAVCLHVVAAASFLTLHVNPAASLLNCNASAGYRLCFCCHPSIPCDHH